MYYFLLLFELKFLNFGIQNSMFNIDVIFVIYDFLFDIFFVSFGSIK